jgi:hypothetical protein
MKMIASLALMVSFVIPSAGALVPEFKLPDVNPISARRNSQVSPRDYLLQVSGYYFGMAH